MGGGGVFPLGWNTSECYTQIAAHSVWSGRFLKPLSTDSFTSQSPFRVKRRESPTSGSRCAKSPPLERHLRGHFRNYTSTDGVPHLEVPLVLLMERLEEFVRARDERNHLEFLQPTPRRTKKTKQKKPWWWTLSDRYSCVTFESKSNRCIWQLKNPTVDLSEQNA